MGNKVTAIVLSAGMGKRMGTDKPKQYLIVNEKPILFYTIKAFEESNVDDIIIVCGEKDKEYCTKEIVQYFNFNKVKKVIAGGKERYNSVYNALEEINDCDYVLIHDGARPCIKPKLINLMIDRVITDKACIMAVPVKDTIKIVYDGVIIDSPDRRTLWQAQTPQAFEFEGIKKAYRSAIKDEEKQITDDAKVWSLYMGAPVKIVEGEYENIKVTTKSDLEIIVNYLK